MEQDQEKKSFSVLVRTVISAIQSRFSMEIIKAFFYWKYSGIIIPFFWTGVIGLVSLAFVIENSRLIFILADIFAFAATCWSLGYWLTCDFLRSKNPQTWSKAKQKKATRKKRDLYYKWKYIISACIVIPFIFTYFFISWISLEKELSSRHGWVYPGNDKTPFNTCADQSKGEMIVFLGKFAVLVDTFPKDVLIVNGKKSITVDKNPDGSMSISLDIFDDTGHIITRINKGEFDVINDVLRRERKDRHSLRIVSNKGIEVINMKYINKSALWLNMTLNYPHHTRLIIDEHGIRLGNGAIVTDQLQCVKGQLSINVP
jgi:hypothetical protein